MRPHRHDNARHPHLHPAVQRTQLPALAQNVVTGCRNAERRIIQRECSCTATGRETSTDVALFKDKTYLRVSSSECQSQTPIMSHFKVAEGRKRGEDERGNFPARHVSGFFNECPRLTRRDASERAGRQPDTHPPSIFQSYPLPLCTMSGLILHSRRRLYRIIYVLYKKESQQHHQSLKAVGGRLSLTCSWYLMTAV